MAGESKGHNFEDVKSISDFLLSKTQLRPTIGVICGSGLGGLVNNIENKEEFSYEDIPGFPVSTVKGHAGKLVFGTIKEKILVCLQGRFHFYEGHGINKCTLPVRVMALLGIKTLIVTNAAGGINRGFSVGDIMVIKDHIGIPCLAGISPLVGLNDERFGPRFPSMNGVYDNNYQKLALDISGELGYGDFIKSGVYCMVSGPCYETPAELRFIQTIGGDAVGMSTVPEVIVAAHMGIKCLGLSLITNYCILDYETKNAPNHAEVLEVAQRRSECVLEIVTKFIANIE
ncbi:purine nucleoside phosphorylase isoform X1 [Hydra vulgaris]|uniref:Purine nucleoside phosphorylase n=1 Tax=Hydra vulgaris TaxID=6087 RepID=T2MI18_HYDVU|nr:purine nucleoside phosphorylase-like [Hydra vulgaris]